MPRADRAASSRQRGRGGFCCRGQGFTVTALVPFDQGQVIRALDADRLIERWREGRSPQTLRAYSNDLLRFSDWLGRFLGNPTLSTAQAVTTLLTKPQGEANEIVRAYRS